VAGAHPPQQWWLRLPPWRSIPSLPCAICVLDSSGPKVSLVLSGAPLPPAGLQPALSCPTREPAGSSLSLPPTATTPESEETSYSGFFEKCEDLCEISLIRSLFRGISAAPPIDDFSFLDCADQLQSTKLSPSCDIRFDRGHLAPSLPPHQCDLSFDFPSPRLAMFCRINSPRMISSIPLPFSSSGRLLSREQSL
jgi:hypothetical protein